MGGFARLHRTWLSISCRMCTQQLGLNHQPEAGMYSQCLANSCRMTKPNCDSFIKACSVTAALAVTRRRRGLSMGKPQSVALVQTALLQNLRKSITARILAETGIVAGSGVSDHSIWLVSLLAIRLRTMMTVLGRPMLVRPVPLIQPTIALRARSTFPVLRASEGNNETAPASSKPTIFYGGRSFTESEVAQCNTSCCL